MLKIAIIEAAQRRTVKKHWTDNESPEAESWWVVAEERKTGKTSVATINLFFMTSSYVRTDFEVMIFQTMF